MNVKRNSFYLCIALIVLSLFLGNAYYNQIKVFGSAEEGNVWINSIKFICQHPNFLLGITILVPATTGILLEEEIKSRFILFSYIRSGKTSYIFKHFLLNIFVSICTIGVALITYGGISYIMLRRLKFPQGLGIIDMEGLVELGGGIFRVMLFASIWAIVGSLGAVIVRNGYMASLISFVIFYVSTNFQERYYRELYWLNSERWVIVQSELVVVAVMVEIAVILLLWMIFYILVKRRIAYV